jgi:hypothetical protein
VFGKLRNQNQPKQTIQKNIKYKYQKDRFKNHLRRNPIACANCNNPQQKLHKPKF